ncbi:hypothetical protein [Demequina litorisediminis]|uniref:Uncharacterized protein n=1 Tax=Demequina litorisediminis TaxID=1849022 RepID=A0ABQ6IC68_9MICO|nr:hypothetical protein [Demequina litorisediminis]GMA34772.1 hypothetical protein GCM10025876_09760 [Demequina litorisediminis]
MLGRAAADPVFGGSGSGSVDTNTAVNARTGLENAGFSINDEMYQAIDAYAQENKRGHIEMDLPMDSTYTIGEPAHRSVRGARVVVRRVRRRGRDLHRPSRR